MYGPFKSDIVISHQESGLVLGTSTSQTSLLGRGKKVTVVYGTTVDVSGNPVGGVWLKVQQGTGPAALVKSDALTGEYVVFDGQLCTGDGLSGCSSGSTFIFVNGTNVNSTVTVLGNGGATPTFAATSTYPTPFTKFCVFQGVQSCSLSTLNPVHSFGVTKGSAYNKNWKFST
jgi:hypothetical protein